MNATRLVMLGALVLVTAAVGSAPWGAERPPADPPGITAFAGGKEGYGWYFFPRLLQTPSGDLLVFSEAHKECKGSDQGWIDIVLKRSTDGGKSWSALQVMHSEYEKSPGTWIGNPAPLIDFETSTVWLLMTRNNTDVLVMSSQDWGETWSPVTVISDQVLAPEWRSKPFWKGGWGWVATTGALQLKQHGGRLLVVGDVQTAPTANCSDPYYKGLLRDGRACSQTWVMFSDTHGKTWNYSRTLLWPGDEVSNPAELSNGSVILNMRGHDLRSYDKGDPNKAMRWLGRSDNGGTTWPSDRSHMRPLINTSSGQPMHFGGDCFGDMTGVLPVSMAQRDTSEWLAAEKDLLVMVAVFRVGQGINGRNDYRMHRSWDGGNSWELVTVVYPGSTSYSGIIALNSTHVGVMYNAGGPHIDSMLCGAVTKYVVVCVRCKHQQTDMLLV